MDDLFGLGKILPIDKLLEIMSISVGRISKPYFDKKDIDTKAYEIEKLAQARAKEMHIIASAVKDNFSLTGGIEYKEEKLQISSPKESLTNANKAVVLDLEERIHERVNYQQAKKQLNIENITAITADELREEPPITNESIDEDWTTRFFKIAEDVSNEEMQSLWGKILAGEIKRPRTYSLRTLELIRNLSKIEASTFNKVAKLAIKVGDASYLFKTNDSHTLETFGIKYKDIALLTEIGLIQPGTYVNYQLPTVPKDRQQGFIAGQTVLILDIAANSPMLSLPVHVFTTAGNELLNLTTPNPPFDYLTKVANSIKNVSVEVKYSQLVKSDDSGIQYTMPLKDFPA